MKYVLIILSFIGLILTLIPSILVFAQVISADLHKTAMLIGTLLWFFTAPFWMKKQQL